MYNLSLAVLDHLCMIPRILALDLYLHQQHKFFNVSSLQPRSLGEKTMEK